MSTQHPDFQTLARHGHPGDTALLDQPDELTAHRIVMRRPTHVLIHTNRVKHDGQRYYITSSQHTHTPDADQHDTSGAGHYDLRTRTAPEALDRTRLEHLFTQLLLSH